jgi:hypothetical protein
VTGSRSSVARCIRSVSWVFMGFSWWVRARSAGRRPHRGPCAAGPGRGRCAW